MNVEFCVGSLRYPPYTDQKLGMLSWAMKKTLKSGKVNSTFFVLAVLALLLGYFVKVISLY